MTLSRHKASMLCCPTLAALLLCCATHSCLTNSPFVSIVVKPGQQLIDMEEDDPWGLLNNEHLEGKQES